MDSLRKRKKNKIFFQKIPSRTTPQTSPKILPKIVKRNLDYIPDYSAYSFPLPKTYSRPYLPNVLESSFSQSQKSIFFAYKKNHPTKKIFLKITIAVLIIFFLTLAGTGIYFTRKIQNFGNKIVFEKENSSSISFTQSAKIILKSVIPISKKRAPIKGENEGKINILFLGIAGEDSIKSGKNLTDTIIILSIDTRAHKVGMISLPRDLYVKIANSNFSSKINSIYEYGLHNNLGTQPILKTVEKISGLPIHYFAILDFTGFEKIIDDLGGIFVNVEEDIYDPRYPGPGYSYETFELKKGFQRLDGKTALKYTRERHDDPRGDFGRSYRQQKVIQSVTNKVFSLKTFLNIFAVGNLLDTLGNHLKTNISLEEIESFIALAKELGHQQIISLSIDAWKENSLLKVTHIEYENNLRAFALIPKIGQDNYEEIQKAAQNLFH